MKITKTSYRKHKRGRRDFPTFEQYVANSEAAHARLAERRKLVASVVVQPGQTIGQIFTANPTLSSSIVLEAVQGNYEIIGYRAGSEVYGRKK